MGGRFSMTDIRAHLESIKPATDYGGRGHISLGMGRPLSVEQADMHLVQFRTKTPSREALDIVDKLGLRECLIEMLTSQREHTARIGSPGFYHAH
jgi:hypothetical protein